MGLDVKNLDLRWFWIGYTAGANRKEKKDSPNRIFNLGKQGVKTIPTEKQKVSFFIGLYVGRGKLVQNINKLCSTQFQDRNAHKSKGDYLTLGMPEIETYRGATVTMPLTISNNRVDNRGSCGYQAKIKYNPSYLRLNTITQGDQSLSFQYQHETASGLVLIQGMKDEVDFADKVVAYLSFTVLPSAPSEVAVSLQGPTGQGVACDIFTKIEGELYYIQPITLESGKIKFIDEAQTPTPPSSSTTITTPIVGTQDDLIGPGGEFDFDFGIGLYPIGPIDPSLPAGQPGGSLIVGITTSDGQRVEVKIPIDEGDNHYKGKLPITLPHFGRGPFVFDFTFKPNDPNMMYYWFIKAGALWFLSSEIPRDEVGTVPLQPFTITKYDYFVLSDDYRVYFGDDEPIIPPITDVSITEIMQILDSFVLGVEEKADDGEGYRLMLRDGFNISFE